MELEIYTEMKPALILVLIILIQAPFKKVDSLHPNLCQK